MATLKTTPAKGAKAAPKLFNIKKAIAPRDETPRDVRGTMKDYLVDAVSTSISSSVKDVNAKSKVTLRIDYEDDTRGMLFFSKSLTAELRAKTITVSQMYDYDVAKFSPQDPITKEPIINEETGEIVEIFVICRPEGSSRIDVTIDPNKKKAVDYNDLW